MQLTEDEQYSCSRTVPTKSNSLLEQQYFRHIVRFFKTFQILLFARQPYSQFLVSRRNILYLLQICLHLSRNSRIFCCHTFCDVVRKLNQQQRIDVRSFFFIGFSQQPALFQSTLYQVNVQLVLVVIAFSDIRIQHHLFLDHLFLHHLFATNGHLVVRVGLWRSRDANLHFGIDFLQYLRTLISRLRPEQMFLINHHDNRQALFFLSSASNLIERSILL